MDTRPIIQGLARYTVLVGALSVGLVYLLTHSGLYILIVGGIGLFLIVLGGAAGGTMSASSVEGAEEAGLSGMMVEDMGLRPSAREFDTRGFLLFYGLGLVLWAIVVLTVFRSGLQ